MDVHTCGTCQMLTHTHMCLCVCVCTPPPPSFLQVLVFEISSYFRISTFFFSRSVRVGQAGRLWAGAVLEQAAEGLHDATRQLISLLWPGVVSNRDGPEFLTRVLRVMFFFQVEVRAQSDRDAPGHLRGPLGYESLELGTQASMALGFRV